MDEDERPPIACGLDITKFQQVFCCRCGNRDRKAEVAGAIMLRANRPINERSESPTGNTQLPVYNQQVPQFGMGASPPPSPPPSPPASPDETASQSTTPPPPASTESSPEPPIMTNQLQEIQRQEQVAGAEESMPALTLPANAMINNANKASDQEDEYQALFAGSSSDTESEQPSSPHQPPATTMAGMPTEPLTPPQALPLMIINGTRETEMEETTTHEQQFEDGEYVVSDTESEGDRMSYTNDSEDDDIPPDIAE